MTTYYDEETMEEIVARDLKNDPALAKSFHDDAQRAYNYCLENGIDWDKRNRSIWHEDETGRLVLVDND